VKQLFMLRTRKNGPAVVHDGKVMYFSDKAEAKVTRNALRAQGQPDVVVSYGPDHRLFKGA
jgi:sugar lactone lactonase YvrE